ncbi:uncharacterized protein G2W53_031946 [Senna tora]|uniref:Uncharacterized protein n=1 Tax=Senna tora TaxID=362788 RepID=A0A834SVB3_9FABA|nr:uncharacterized protein G2W53_031946 [Senna tora]
MVKELPSFNLAILLQDLLTKWTDQQHSLYLNSLEASFVNELYHYKRLHREVQNNLKEADKAGALQKSHNMPGQFLILQDGCWKKISHERNEPMLESTADSHVLAGSPLRFTSAERGSAMREIAVRHYGLCCDESHIRGSSIFSGRSPRSSRTRYLESDGSTAEFSDQNFKDDEDQRVRSSCMPMEKRLKTEPVDDASRNDQVVMPLGKIYSTELSTTNNSSSEKEDQHELLSELPEGFHAPKSDMHYFLRGCGISDSLHIS